MFRRLVFAGFVIGAFLMVSCSLASPEETLEEFYQYHEPGRESLDPLILAGKRVVPLVIERIQDKTMPRRMLAIEFLGNGSYDEALPVLESILNDTFEQENMRATALIAIYQIEPQKGTRDALRYQGESGEFGKVSRDILAKKDYLDYRRTFFDALVRRHD